MRSAAVSERLSKMPKGAASWSIRDRCRAVRHGLSRQSVSPLLSESSAGESGQAASSAPAGESSGDA